MVRWGFPRRFGRFGWEPSQLSSGGVRVKVVVRGSFRGSSFPFSFSAPRRRRAGRAGRGGHPERPLERADWGGSPGPKPRRWLRAGREPVAGVGGGGGLAARGGGRGFPRGPFPAAGAGFPAQGHLRSFSAKRQDNKPRRICVVCDTSPPRRGRVTRICRSPFSPRRRPRRAEAGFFSRRGLFRGRAARPRPPPGPFPGPRPPRPPPRRGPSGGHAARPAARAPARQTSPLCFGKVRPARSTFQLCFAEVRPPWSAFVLCSGEVRPARSALPRCSAKVRVPAFALRSGEVRPAWSAFALCSEEVRPARSTFALCSEEVSSPRGASDPCAPLLGDRGPVSC